MGRTGLGAALLCGTAVMAASGAWGQSSLSTTFEGGNAANGILFDVNVLGGDLTVTGLDLGRFSPAGTTSIPYEVYTRPGTFSDGAGSAAGWVLAASGGVSFNSGESIAFADVADFVLPGGETTALYVLYGSGGLVRYTNVDDTSVAASNDDLEITGGVGSSGGFSADFSFRLWNGTIYYLSGPTAEELAAIAAALEAARLAAEAEAARREVAAFEGNATVVYRLAADTARRIARQQADRQVGGGGLSFAATASKIRPWADLSGFAAREGDARYSGAGVRVGADMAVRPDLVVGLSLGADEVRGGPDGLRQEGDLYTLQPYLQYSVGATTIDASVIAGWGDLEQGDADGDTRLRAASVGVRHDILIGGATVTPMASLLYGEVDLDDGNGRLAALDGTTTFFEGSLGARLSTVFEGGRAFAGLHADYVDADDDTLSVLGDDFTNDGWSGRVEIGADLSLGRGLDLTTTLDLGGIGDGDDWSASGNVGLTWRF